MPLVANLPARYQIILESLLLTVHNEMKVGVRDCAGLRNAITESMCIFGEAITVMGLLEADDHG